VCCVAPADPIVCRSGGREQTGTCHWAIYNSAVSAERHDVPNKNQSAGISAFIHTARLGSPATDKAATTARLKSPNHFPVCLRPTSPTTIVCIKMCFKLTQCVHSHFKFCVLTSIRKLFCQILEIHSPHYDATATRSWTATQMHTNCWLHWLPFSTVRNLLRCSFVRHFLRFICYPVVVLWLVLAPFRLFVVTNSTFSRCVE